MNEVVIALGSNIEPERNMERARAILSREHELVREAPAVRTTPRDFTDQPDFLNGAALIRTPLSRSELKQRLRAVESELGRVRGGHRQGPRTIDLDIVVWNGRVLDTHVYSWDFLRDAVRELLPDLELSGG